MKGFALALFACWLVLNGLAQNLVPNGSFEEHVQCPHFQAQIEYAEGWFTYMGTADYYNVCDTAAGFGVPDNLFGYQQAATGGGYAGIYCFSGDEGDPDSYREILGHELSSPLQVGTAYHVTFKVSWTTSFPDLWGAMSVACDRLGVEFRTTAYEEFAWSALPDHAHVWTDQIVTDSAGWTIVSGSFIADSAYEYIALGNLFDDSLTTWQEVDPNGTYDWSYYYIDDICVSMDPEDCPLWTAIQPRPAQDLAIHPNPFTEEVHVSLGSLRDEAVHIDLRDSAGRIVKSWALQSVNDEVVLPTEDLSPGAYALTVRTRERVRTARIVKQ